MKFLWSVLAVAALFVMNGCLPTDNPVDVPIVVNGAPVITASTPVDSVNDVARSGQLTFSVTATDPESDPLTYSWSARGGVLGTNGTHQITWTLPDSISMRSISVAISDGKGHSVTKTWTASVGILHVRGTIATPTHWLAGNVYLVTGDVGVTSTLTIDSTVVVLFSAGTGLSADANGTITANGTTGKHVVFSSIKDDSKVGDINGDLATSTPAKDDWYGVGVYGGNNSTFNYCDLSYSNHGLYVNGKATVNGCVISQNTLGLDVNDASVGTTCTNNTIFDNTDPMYINGNVSIDGSNSFGSGAVRNTHQYITISQATVNGAITWDTTGIPIVLTLGVEVEGALTIKPGVIVKFPANAYIGVTANGTIIANGTATNRIIFTSIKDDIHGGDNNGDAAASTPARSDWGQIRTEGNNSSFTYCDILYSEGGVVISHSKATISYCRFAHNKNGLDLSSATTGTVWLSDTLFDNETPVFANGDININASNIFHDPAGISPLNTYQGIFMGYVSVNNSVNWNSSEVGLVFDNYLEVNSTLTLGANTILKFKAYAAASIDANGSIPGFSGAIFTSYKDDAQGGDANGDGTATSASAGDWDGVRSDSANDWLHSSAHANILYAAH